VEPIERRRTPRYALASSGLHRYAVDWSPPAGSRDMAHWNECRLIDISERGATLEPLGTEATEPLAGEIELELPAPAEIREVLRFRGEIRHATRSAEGHLRIGIEFTELTALETNLLDLLVRLDAFA